MEKGALKRLGVECALGLGVLGVALLFLSSSTGDPKALMKVYSRIYNFPEANVWTQTFGLLSACVLAGVAVLTCKRGISGLKRESWAWAIVLFGIASVVFAAYPGFLLASRLHVASSEFFAPMAVGLAAGLVFAYVLFACPQAFSNRWIVLAVPVVTILACYLAVPTWRAAAVELVTPGTHIQDEVAKEVGKLVPHDAILLGERSSQVCMSLPIRTATTFLANSNPIPVIEALRKREPDVKLYGRIFSWTFIFLANVGIVLAWLASMTPLTFAELGGLLAQRIISAYTGVWSAFWVAVVWIYRHVS